MNVQSLVLRSITASILTVCVALSSGLAAAQERPAVTEHLQAGQLASAEESLSKHLGNKADDDLARFQLGTVQFFGAVEGLAQDSYRYGLQPNLRMIPFLRTPVASNPNPQPVSYTDVRAMIQRFVQSVERAETTLAPIKDDQLAWSLDLTQVRLDTNGNGQAEPDETLWFIFQRFAAPREQAAQPEEFTIGLDSADVQWLRGYCHLLAALGEMILAYDHERQFDLTAQLFFAKPQTSFAAVLDQTKDSDEQRGPWDRNGILDAIAFIHLADFPVQDAQRLTKAREHLLAMIDSSRKSWKLIEAETDNNREWIPGPDQESVVEGVAMTQERLDAWRRFLDEAEAVLNGKKLIPFWRNGAGRGVNLKRVFIEPKPFDLVLWVQGSGALPYLEEGEITAPETWAEFQRVFSGRFVGFAIWIN